MLSLRFVSQLWVFLKVLCISLFDDFPSLMVRTNKERGGHIDSFGESGVPPSRTIRVYQGTNEEHAQCPHDRLRVARPDFAVNESCMGGRIGRTDDQ